MSAEVFARIGMDIAKTVIWALVASCIMSLSLGILLKVFAAMTPIDEWEEIKKGNTGVAIILASVVLAFAAVVVVVIR